MAENRKRDPIPENFETLEDFWEFWDKVVYEVNY